MATIKQLQKDNGLLKLENHKISEWNIVLQTENKRLKESNNVIAHNYGKACFDLEKTKRNEWQ